jgi:RNA polymerase sigma factor (sigma-70 family)
MNKMTKVFNLPNTEQRLIKQCKKGNLQAQRELYQRYSGEMLAVCRRYTKGLEDAEEVLSNGFIKFFKNIDQFRGEGAVGAWMRRIMVREALNFIRYQKNLFVEVDEERSAAFSKANETQHYDVEHLMMMISALPMGYKTVFNLYAIEGYNHKEIGEMLEISENTSKSQLSKARKRLQEKLAQHQLLYKNN